MKTKARNKKVWTKPLVDLMKINRDTFSGSGIDTEKGTGGGQTTKKP
jgi:hypothetical protein